MRQRGFEYMQATYGESVAWYVPAAVYVCEADGIEHVGVEPTAAVATHCALSGELVAPSPNEMMYVPSEPPLVENATASGAAPDVGEAESDTGFLTGVGIGPPQRSVSFARVMGPT